MDMANCPGRLTPEMAVAAIQEMRTWLELMQLHARLIRNTLNTEEERLFRYADSLAQAITALRRRFEGQDDMAIAGCARELIAETNAVVVPLRQLKAEMAEAVPRCCVICSLPADLLDHIRREADVFLGIINGLVGGPVPSRTDIGVPASPTAPDARASLAPRSLIPGLIASSPACANEVLWDEIIFFTRINAEHGPVLALYFRPQVQEDLVRATTQFSEAIRPILDQLEAARQQGLSIPQARSLIEADIAATVPWVTYLRQLHAAILTCQVPTGQVNFPAQLAEHMAEEGDYSLQLMQMAVPT